MYGHEFKLAEFGQINFCVRVVYFWSYVRGEFDLKKNPQKSDDVLSQFFFHFCKYLKRSHILYLN